MEPFFFGQKGNYIKNRKGREFSSKLYWALQLREQTKKK